MVIHASLELDDPRCLLSGKTLKFSWTHAGNHRASRVSFPELLHNPMRTWGDWGPMHSIRLRPHQQVLVFTRCEEGSIEQVSHLMPAQLLLESPLLDAERDQIPLVLTLDDHWRGFRYRLGLNHAGDIAMADVRQTDIPLQQRQGASAAYSGRV